MTNENIDKNNGKWKMYDHIPEMRDQVSDKLVMSAFVFYTELEIHYYYNICLLPFLKFCRSLIPFMHIIISVIPGSLEYRTFLFYFFAPYSTFTRFQWRYHL